MLYQTCDNIPVNYFNVTTLVDLFKFVRSYNIIHFLKAITIFNDISIQKRILYALYDIYRVGAP